MKRVKRHTSKNMFSNLRWKTRVAGVLLAACTSASADTFIVESTSAHAGLEWGINFEQAVAAANENPGPDIILFSNQSFPSPEGQGYTIPCFQFDEPVVFTETAQVIGVDDDADRFLDQSGQPVPAKRACLSYTGEDTAITFDASATGSEFRIFTFYGADQPFQLCAQGLALEAWLTGSNPALQLCSTSAVEAEAKLTMSTGPEGAVVLDADLPPDADLDLSISTTAGAMSTGPVVLNLEASECGSKVRLSGVDIRGGLQVAAKGCVDLLVDQFSRESVYEGGLHMPWLAASSWSPAAVELVPAVTIQNSLLTSTLPSDGQPVITLDGAQLRVAHSTLTANNTAPDEVIRMTNADFLANHSIIAGNTGTALSASGSDIELIYSMVDSTSLDTSSLTADEISEAWLLNATQPDLEAVDFMPSSSSQALNAGDAGLEMGVDDTPLTDLRGQQRIIDGVIDIGARERNRGPAFDDSAATYELVRQRNAGNDELVLDLERYISDTEGDSFEVTSVVPQQDVVYREDLGQLIVPATSRGVLAWIYMEDEHGGRGFSTLNAMPRAAGSGSSGGGGSATALILLLLLLAARRTSPT